MVSKSTLPAYWYLPAVTGLIAPLEAYRIGHDWWSVGDTLLPIMLIILFAYAVAALVYWRTKNGPFSLLMASSATYLLFKYEELTIAVSAIGPWIVHDTFPIFIAMMMIALMLRLLGHVLRQPNALLARRAVHVLILVHAGVLAALAAPVAISHSWLNHDKTASHEMSMEAVDVTSPDRELPDIYYIIPDGYANARHVLQPLYGMEANPLLPFLREKGFYIAEDSRSNYVQTMLSIPSSLNMEYLQTIYPEMNPKEASRAPLSGLVKNNTVMNNLRHLGYDINILENGFLDREESNALMSLHDRVIKMSPLTLLTFFQAGYNFNRLHIQLIEDGIAAIKQAAHRTNHANPVFFLAHFINPHPPFLATRDGWIEPGPLYRLSDGSHLIDWWGMHDLHGDNREERQAYYREAYRDQLLYFNTRIMEMVETILAHNARPVLIILQADHGPGSLWRWDVADKQAIGPASINERTGIINAYYFHDQRYDALYPHITPVNSFRVMLNQYFGQSLPLLDDRVFVSLWERPYDFRDVTSQLRDMNHNEASRPGQP